MSQQKEHDYEAENMYLREQLSRQAASNTEFRKMVADLTSYLKAPPPLPPLPSSNEPAAVPPAGLSTAQLASVPLPGQTQVPSRQLPPQPLSEPAAVPSVPQRVQGQKPRLTSRPLSRQSQAPFRGPPVSQRVQAPEGENNNFKGRGRRNGGNNRQNCWLNYQQAYDHRTGRGLENSAQDSCQESDNAIHYHVHFTHEKKN